MKKTKGILAMALGFLLNNFLAIIITMLLMTLFSIIVGTNFGWIVDVVKILALLALLYHQAWIYGSRDLENGVGNRTNKAVAAAFLAATPTLIFALMASLATLGVYTPGIMVSEQSLVEIVYRTWSLPFEIIFSYFGDYPVLYFVPFIAVAIPPIVGYIFGYKQIKLSDYLYYARDNNE